MVIEECSTSCALHDIAGLDEKLCQFHHLGFIFWELHVITCFHICWWFIIAYHICQCYLNICPPCFFCTPVSVADTNKWDAATECHKFLSGYPPGLMNLIPSKSTVLANSLTMDSILLFYNLISIPWPWFNKKIPTTSTKVIEGHTTLQFKKDNKILIL